MQDQRQARVGKQVQRRRTPTEVDEESGFRAAVAKQYGAYVPAILVVHLSLTADYQDKNPTGAALAQSGNSKLSHALVRETVPDVAKKMVAFRFGT